MSNNKKSRQQTENTTSVGKGGAAATPTGQTQSVEDIVPPTQADKALPAPRSDHTVGSKAA
ncbi:hypothetical protein BH11VER1_BH11VER1_36730 [soil metagenome]